MTSMCLWECSLQEPLQWPSWTPLLMQRGLCIHRLSSRTQSYRPKMKTLKETSFLTILWSSGMFMALKKSSLIPTNSWIADFNQKSSCVKLHMHSDLIPPNQLQHHSNNPSPLELRINLPFWREKWPKRKKLKDFSITSFISTDTMLLAWAVLPRKWRCAVKAADDAEAILQYATILEEMEDDQEAEMEMYGHVFE